MNAMEFAVAAALCGQRRVPSMFSNLVRDKRCRVKHMGAHRGNLRTNDGLDWMAALFGDFNNNFGAQGTMSFTSTTLTDSAAAWTTNQWKGRIVAVNSSTTPFMVYGVVLSNTGAVLTVDRWYTPSAPSGAAAATPTGVGLGYQIVHGGCPHWWMALTADATAPAAGDTTLASEITTNGLARAMATSYSHTAGVASYSISKTFTCTGGSNTVNKEAVFNAQNGGRMPFESAESSPPTLVSGDTLAQTVSVTI